MARWALALIVVGLLIYALVMLVDSSPLFRVAV